MRDRSCRALVASLVVLMALPGLALGQGVPRARPGGTPYNAQQSLTPYALRAGRSAGAAGSAIVSPPEYAPQRGVLFSPDTTFYPPTTDMIAALTANPDSDDIAYVMVTNQQFKTITTNRLAAAGADMSKVQFIVGIPFQSIWIRDFGPHFVWDEGALAIADSHYFPTWHTNNFIPTRLAREVFFTPSSIMGLYYSGGNFQAGPDRSGFVTSLVRLDNPASDGFDDALIAELFRKYQGIDTLHILPQLPRHVDGTGHLDMWFYLVDESTVIISRFDPGSDPVAVEITDSTAAYMQSMGFRVLRTPDRSVDGLHTTYANAVRVNETIFIPAYGTLLAPGSAGGGDPAHNARDQEALAIWQAAAGPGVRIVPIQSMGVIGGGGALHCITKQVPRYTADAPAVHVVSPRGGETWLGGTTQTIRWGASDTDNRPVPTVDLFYSTSEGQTWTAIARGVPNAGSFQWTIPSIFSRSVKVKVVAHALDAGTAHGVSEGVFTIGAGTQSLHTFASGAGVDKWAFGFETIGWAAIDSQLSPVSTPLSLTDYARLAFRDASGGDSDIKRYISPAVQAGKYSTHTFEFVLSEDLAAIDEIKVAWDGYAQDCTQVELYVWDRIAQQWGDGRGLLGQNRYMDNWAGIGNGPLRGFIRSDFARYVGSDGKIKFMVYAQRPQDKTFHDSMEVVVKRLAPVQRNKAGRASAAPQTAVRE